MDNKFTHILSLFEADDWLSSAIATHVQHRGEACLLAEVIILLSPGNLLFEEVWVD